MRIGSYTYTYEQKGLKVGESAKGVVQNISCGMSSPLEASRTMTPLSDSGRFICAPFHAPHPSRPNLTGPAGQSKTVALLLLSLSLSITRVPGFHHYQWD